ncbi:MAG: NRDE family protein [Planctomycetota bacterium]|nr:NRDE family protein [Planctomycetota bacterium]
MSLLAVLYKLVPESPILIAFNREELVTHKVTKPTIQSGKPRILASMDSVSGGTWLGVNQHGMMVGATSRRKFNVPMAPKSREALCRDLLRCGSARDAVNLAMDELHTNEYEGVNYIIADGESGWFVHGGNELEANVLEEGLNIVSDRNVNDPRDERVAMARRLLTLQTLDSPVKFLAVASKVLARAPSGPGRPSMVVHDGDYGTVSSTLVSLGIKPRDAIYQFANGSPDENKFEDFSPMLRDILSRGLREARLKTASV